MKSDERMARNIGQQIFLWGSNFGNGRDHFFWILQRIIKEHYEKNPIQDILLVEYKKFEDFLCSDDVEISVLAPIFNLRLDYSNKLDLESILDTKGIAIIREIQESEKYHLMFEMNTLFESHITISKSNLVLDLKYREPKFIGDSAESGKRKIRLEIEQKIENIIAALRLLNDEFVGCGVITFKPTMGELSSTNMSHYEVKDFFPSNPKILYDSNGYIKFEEIPVYTLGQKDLHDLGAIFKSLEYKRSNSNIAFALSRYQDSFQNESLEDKFIDLSVAVESLFSLDEKDIQGSLSHKYSLRLSRFIEHNEHDRQVTYRTMHKLYGQRSSIVHPKAKKSELQLNLLRNLVRRAIREYLSRLSNNSSLTHESIIGNIDFA